MKWQQLNLKLGFEKQVILPTHFQSTIQGLIYSFFGNWTFLHDKGYIASNGKVFKLFTFGIRTRLKKKGDKFYSKSENMLELVISSPVDEIYDRLLFDGLFSNREHKLGDNKLMFAETNLTPVEVSREVIVRTVSPITAGYTKDGKTVYFSYTDENFGAFIQNNARTKWEAYHKEKCDCELKITPIVCHKHVAFLKFDQPNRCAVTGYRGIFRINSDNEDFLAFSLLSGLGYKNASGFGCVEVLEVVK